jgi:uncharacterized protein (TIGR02231 family)
MTPLPSTIVAVTVFMDRARVTRRGKLELAQGDHRLTFDDLPLQLDPASIRVSARGTVPVKLRGVDVQKAFFAQPPNERVRDLEAAIRVLENHTKALYDQSTVCSKEIESLDGVLQVHDRFARGLGSGRLAVDAFDGILRFHAERREQLATKWRELQNLLTDKKAEKEKLEREKSQVWSAQNKDRLVVALELEASAAGTVEVDVTYMLKGAGWRPLYDIRLMGDDIEVTYLGEVTQSTGEDWNGVSLSLSTARPAAATAIPLLTPMVVRPRQREPQEEFMAMRAMPAMMGRRAGAVTMSAAGSADMAGDTACLEAPAAIEQATVEQSGAAVTFNIPSKIDVPSDESPHKATVGIFRLKPRFDFVAVPKIAESVFRRVKATNATAYTLLPGLAQLFVADDFLGSVPIKLTAPNQEIELAFGVEDRLTVERGVMKRDVGKTMLTARRRNHFGYEIRLKNHFAAPQLVTVVDHFAKPEHEDIKATLDSVDPKPSRQDDLNVMIWKVTVPANGQQKIKYEFTVEHPREMVVQGLD